jgi:hypothetical protein
VKPRLGEVVTYRPGYGRPETTGVVVSVEGNLCWTKYEGQEKALPFIWRFAEGLNTLHDWPSKHSDEGMDE